jgi:tRNA threonylcarbamoyladenosine biosynthesis protein TsaE
MSDSAVLEFKPQSLAATEALARQLARRARPGDVIALHGDLGAGKTTFARAFIRTREGGAQIAEVPSPTFTLVQVYDLQAGAVWHFDLYRLTRPEQAWELGLEEAMTGGISLIEWPERLGDLLPGDRLDVEIISAGGEARVVRLVAAASWAQRLARLTADA